MYKNREISLIVAVDENDGIGFDGGLPWPTQQEDMAWFKEKTENNIVIMGRKTKDGLPIFPLPNRDNFVITSTFDRNGEYFATHNTTGQYISLKTALETILGWDYFNEKEIFIIGGAQLYKTAFDMDIVDKVWMTTIKGQYECDTFFPTMPGRWDTMDMMQSDSFTRILMAKA